jgi:type I restriction enzyme S subunit
VSALFQRSWSQAVPLSAIIGKDCLQNGKSVKSAHGSDCIQCLTLSSMRQGRIDTHCAKAVPLTFKEAQFFFVKRNDVFIVRGNGSKELCGLAGQVKNEVSRLIFPDLFIKVQLPNEKFLPEFSVVVWNSSVIREVIEEKAKTTSGIWKINQRHILSIPVPFPSLPEQQRILEECNTLRTEVDGLKRFQSETAAELDALLPAIFDRAFRGEL